MKLIFGLLLTAAASTALGNQTVEKESKSKLTIKDGKEVTVTGCVAPTVGGSGFMLTNVADKAGALHNYVLIPGDEDVAKHVGHLVQIKGKVSDRGDAKVKVETKTKTDVEHGDDQHTTTKSEVQGDTGLPYLGVNSVKLVAGACP